MRPAPCAHNVCGEKGRAPLRSRRKKAYSNERVVHNQTAAGRQSLRQRVVVEHRIARLVQLGIRQSRYFGRTKTCLQVVMAAVVANVSLVAGYCKRQAKLAANPSAEAATAARTGLLGAGFSRLEPTLHSSRASLGVAGGVRTPPRESRHANCRLKDPGSRTDF